MSRYEIKVYREAKIKGKKKPLITYGVWDNNINKWVAGSTRVGREKAETILYLLEQHGARSKRRS